MTGQVSVAGLVRGSRVWTRTHDAHARAAVELLVGHDVWLRRAEFRDACVRRDPDAVWVDWRAVREAFDAGEFDRCSSTERAVLDLAIALGQDRYRLSLRCPATSGLVVAAVTTALGVRGGGAR